MRTPNIGSVQYVPGDPPGAPEQVQRYLREETVKIAAAFTALAAGHQDKINVAPTKPRDGDFRYADGTNWNPGYGAGYYQYVDTAWNRFAYGGRMTANVSATDTVTAVTSANAFVAFAQTYVIPASSLRQGSVLKARALVVVNDASGTDTLTVEIRIGGVSLVATTAVNPGATTDLHLLEFEFMARAAPGATASCVGAGRWITNTGGTIAHGTGLLVPTNFATNGNLTLDVRGKWSSNTANTSARLEMLNVDIF